MLSPLDDTNIPFHIKDLYHGLGEITGRLRCADGVLLLEYRMKDAVFGVLRGRVRELRIPFTDVEEIEFHDGWFRKRIAIRTRSISSFADIPGAEDGVLLLRIARRDAMRARAGISHLKLLHAEQQLRSLDAAWGGE